MATSDKVNKKNPSVSAKQSAKQRRALEQARRQRQQQILLAIVAVALLVGVLLAVFVSTRPVEAYIPDDAKTNYTAFEDQKLMGTTPEGFPFLGAANAPVTMEEVGSLSCIVCQDYHKSTFLNLLDEIKSGRLKFIFIPVTTTGEFNPMRATQAALCANQQGKFWPMHDILFDWQTRYGNGSNDNNRLMAAANALGLDTGKFSSCLDSKEIKDTIDAAQKLADSRGVTGTPTIFLDGQLIQPLPTGQTSPNLSELRGLIESKAANKK